jgi:pimeloyl-ACP methyl ester carboxylesterase
MLRAAIFLLALAAANSSAQERVAFAAADGHPLSGSYLAPADVSRGGVLLLHMYQSSSYAWEPITERLAARGYHVLAIDMRGHGKSAKDPDGKEVDIGRNATRDPASNPFLKMHLDARAGLDLLVEKGAPKDRLAIVGASVGCSVALHCALVNPDQVAALVLMTPGSSYLGVPSLDHARELGDLPVLILSSEEEADGGARPLAEILGADHAELRIVPGSRIHGTRMFGKVPAVEADIIEWLDRALVRAVVLEIPMVKTVLLDGKLSEIEGSGCTWLAVPLERGGEARVRLSRNRRKLILGVEVPERYLRQNEVVFYIDGSGTGPRLPNPSCWAISYSPQNTGRDAIVTRRGDGSAWEEASATGILAYADTRGRESWSAECALSLDEFIGRPTPCEVRLAFQIVGAVSTNESFFPATANVKTAPRSWARARVAGQ